MHRLADCIIGLVIPQTTEWQHIGNEINATFIVARTDFVIMHSGAMSWGYSHDLASRLIHSKLKASRLDDNLSNVFMLRVERLMVESTFEVIERQLSSLVGSPSARDI